MKIFESEAGKVCVEGWLKEQLERGCDCVKIDIGEEVELKRTIRFEINCDMEFSLDLNLSEWSKSYEKHLNGELVVNLSRDGIIKFDKMWKSGDVLELILKMW